MGWQIIKFNDMKIAIIGGSGFVGSRLIGLLQTVPNIELLNIDKQQSELYPHLTQIADVQDVQKATGCWQELILWFYWLPNIKTT